MCYVLYANGCFEPRQWLLCTICVTMSACSLLESAQVELQGSLQGKTGQGSHSMTAHSAASTGTGFPALHGRPAVSGISEPCTETVTLTVDSMQQVGMSGRQGWG